MQVVSLNMIPSRLGVMYVCRPPSSHLILIHDPSVV